jgi:hypothetical protein
MNGARAGFGPHGDWSRGASSNEVLLPRITHPTAGEQHSAGAGASRAAPQPSPRGPPSQLEIDVNGGLADLDEIARHLGDLGPSDLVSVQYVPVPPEHRQVGNDVHGEEAAGVSEPPPSVYANVVSPRFLQPNQRAVAPSRASSKASNQPGGRWKWWPEEDLRLAEGVGYFCQGPERATKPENVENWAAVARHVQTKRTPAQCADRWAEIRYEATVHKLKHAIGSRR